MKPSEMWRILVNETKTKLNEIKEASLEELDKQYIDYFWDKTYTGEEMYSYKSALIHQQYYLASCQNSLRNALEMEENKKRINTLRRDINVLMSLITSKNEQVIVEEIKELEKQIKKLEKQIK